MSKDMMATFNDPFINGSTRGVDCFAALATTYDEGLDLPLAGVDEVGRGCLAGPVVACALVLPNGCKIEGIRDSKKLTQKRRALLEKMITAQAESYAFGIVDAGEIDETNILIATLKAMSIAIRGLDVIPKTVLVDGIHAPECKYPVVCIKGGDSISQTVAAASILAKEHRDRMMREFCEQFPEYGFSAHKGYGTKKHFEAIYLHGLCPLHRTTFLRKSELLLAQKPPAVSASIFAVHS